MSERLSELLRDAVADVPAPHLAGPAAQAAELRRRRVHAGVVAVAAVAVAAVVSGVAVVGRDERSTPPPAISPHPSPHPSPSPSPPVFPHSHAAGDIPLSTYAGVPVFRAPSPARLDGLPQRSPGTPLPATIDLGQPAADVATDPVDRALAAFAVPGEDGRTRSVLLLAGDGTLRSLDVSRLSPVTKPDGYRLDPVTASMLSASGRYLVFPQDGAVELYTLGTGAWRRLPVSGVPTYAVTWDGGDQLLLPDPQRPRRMEVTMDRDGTVTGTDNLNVSALSALPLDGSTPYGRHRTGGLGSDALGTAQAFTAGAPIRGAGDGLPAGQHEFLAVAGHRPAIALFGGTGTDGAWLECCPVVSWLPGGDLAYEVRSAHPEVVAWAVGTGRFQRVSRIVGLEGSPYVASWAMLWSWEG